MKLRPALLHWLALALLSAGLEHALAAVPVVSKVRAAQRAGTPLVDVYYDLADAVAVIARRHQEILAAQFLSVRHNHPA